MGILRRIISLVLLVAAVVALVGICLKYPWGDFAEVFKHFSFDGLVTVLVEFFEKTSSALILAMLGLIGLTMPHRAK